MVIKFTVSGWVYSEVLTCQVGKGDTAHSHVISIFLSRQGGANLTGSPVLFLSHSNAPNFYSWLRLSLPTEFQCISNDVYLLDA